MLVFLLEIINNLNHSLANPYVPLYNSKCDMLILIFKKKSDYTDIVQLLVAINGSPSRGYMSHHKPGLFVFVHSANRIEVRAKNG